MTIRERLHKLVGKDHGDSANGAMPEAAAEEDPLLRAIANAPEDDEPWTEEDEAAMAEVEADRAAGVPLIPFEEIKRKYG